MPCKRYKDYFLAPIEVEILCFKLTGLKYIGLKQRLERKAGTWFIKMQKPFA